MRWWMLVVAGWLLAMVGPAHASGPVVGWGAKPPVNSSAVSAGGFHTCAVQNRSGFVFCWGDTSQGQSSPPFRVLIDILGVLFPFDFRVTAVSAGGSHTCGLEEITSGVVCWGANTFGQSATPASVGFRSKSSGSAVAVAASWVHTCAISTAFAVVCWGRNNAGQALPPIQVNGVGGTASALALGADHSCAIQIATQAVVCWGSNLRGQAAPPPEVNGTLGTAIRIAAGNSHSCAIQTQSRAVVCWGLDDLGQASPPDAVNGVAGTASEIAARGDHSCAVQAGSGSLFCWGLDDEGQAVPPAIGGARSVTAGLVHSCAIQSETGAVFCWGAIGAPAVPPAQVSGALGDATSVTSGSDHSCAIQEGTGAVFCWGADFAGQASPPDGLQAQGVAAGDLHSCAIRAADSTVVCWGANFAKQGTPPPSVDGTSGVASDLAAGLDHTCAVQAGTGAVVCWGANDFFKATPPSTVNGVAGSAVSVSVGNEHSCALQPSGRVVCWGRNVGGRTVPPTGAGGQPILFQALSVGPRFSCAIEQGSLKVFCWGQPPGPPPETVFDPVSRTEVPLRALTLTSGLSNVCVTLADTHGVACWPEGNLASVPPLDLAASQVASGVNHTVAIELPEPGATALGVAALSSLVYLARRRRKAAIPASGARTLRSLLGSASTTRTSERPQGQPLGW